MADRHGPDMGKGGGGGGGDGGGGSGGLISLDLRRILRVETIQIVILI